MGADTSGQTNEVMQNLQQWLKAESLDLSDVVKATVHLQDVRRDFASFNSAYESSFTDGLPVRTTVGSTLLNILVEIDFVAAYPGGDSDLACRVHRGHTAKGLMTI